MNKTKLLASLSLSLALLASCASYTESDTVIDPSSGKGSTSATTQPVDTTPLDRAGNPYTAPTSLDRLISLSPSNTEILVALGLGDRLTVVDIYSSTIEGVPEDVEIVDLQIANIEALLLSDSHLLVASGVNMLDSDNPYQQVADAGVSVVYLPTATSFDDIYADILFLGELTQTKEIAETMVDELQARVDSVVQAVQGAEVKSVYFEISPAPYLYTFGCDTFLDEAITLSGGVNIYADQSGWISPNEEDILTQSPQVILTNADYIEDPVGELLTRENWGEIEAIKTKQVYLLGSDLTSRPSHHAVTALEQIAAAIHPELFA